MLNMDFETFTKQHMVNRSWIKEGEGKQRLRIYVRRTYEGLRDVYGDYQLANITAVSPGNGGLTRFLNKWEPHYTFYVENVLNVGLRRYLERRGYVGDNESHAPSYLKVRVNGAAQKLL